MTSSEPPGGRAVLGFQLLPVRAPVLRRLAQLLPGLVLFGVGLGLSIEADLGTNPWTVFHTGASARLGISIGAVVVITGVGLALLFRPLREPLGLGTLANAMVIGPVINATLAVLPDMESMLVRVAALAVSPVLIGLASGLYIGAGLGPGPRDGLMTALERRGMVVSRARTVVEVTALAAGWLLGGAVGIGTIYMAFTVGIWVRVSLPRLRLDTVPTQPK